MTCFVGLGIFREKRMSPKELARYNKNRREYEQKYKEKERQFKLIALDQVRNKKGRKQ